MRLRIWFISFFELFFFNLISKIAIIQNIFIFGIREYTSMKAAKKSAEKPTSFLLTLSLVFLITAVIIPGVNAANATITGVVPSSGPVTGLTNVTITGTNLTGASLVTFGGTAATNLLVVNDTRINATTPAHAAGVVDVNITTPLNGTANGTGLYTYNAPPSFVGILPSSGPVTGLTNVTITGTNLTGASLVTFGGTAATNLIVVSATQISATIPAHAAGVVDINITSPNGTATGPGAFTYISTKTGVYRPGAGFYLKMNNGSTWNGTTDVFLAWDNAMTDRPVAGDWNADGRTETGVYRPGAGFYLKMNNGSTWNATTDAYLAWDNAAIDLPIAGDWNLDGRTETGVYRPGAGFYLKMDNGSTWNGTTDAYLAWDNAAIDLPVAGDWNNDRRTETGVYRPGVGFFLKMDNGSTWNGTTDAYLAWDNANGDLPIAGYLIN
jgi:hypothetical protein